MAISFNGQKRIRRTFGRIPEVAPMPNLIEVQRSSYDHFLQMGVPAEQRASVGLQEVFKSVFPIRDFSERAQLEFVRYELETPKYDTDECQQRGITYAAPLKVTLRLVVWDVDEDTGSRSIRDIKEQDVYMGDMPLMTRNGTFIINGTERVIVSQMHRSPGVFFDHDKGKTHSSGKYLFAARVIPYRGSWLDFEFDAKDHVYVRIDRRRKLPATTLLLALDDVATEQKRAERRADSKTLQPGEALGMSKEEVLSSFYGTVTFQRGPRGWMIPFDPDQYRGKLIAELIDADTGEVRVPIGDRMTPRLARRLREAGLTHVLAPQEDLIGRYFGHDLINEETGEVYFEAGDEITEAALAQLDTAEFSELPVLDVELVSRGGDSRGPYIRNTLAIDKNATREDALIDIYRVMRPGEPPTLETAEALFNGLFFDSERYDLSAVGRVKMNSRLGLTTDDTVRVLAQGGHPGDPQRAGRSEGRARRDRRHRPSRQPPGALGRRIDGEPVPRRPVAHGAGDPRAHEFGRDRHRDAARFDQRQAGGGGGARVFRLVAALAIHGPDQSFERDHPQAAPVGARARWPDARAGRLRGARRAPDALRPDLPDRDPRGTQYRADQLAGDLCAGQPVRVYREPLPQGQGGYGHRRGDLSVGDGRGKILDRPGRRAG